MSRQKLKDIAKVIRSKNAGPLLITLDVILPDRATYDRVIAANALTPSTVAKLYGLSDNEVAVTPYAQALAIKMTFPRLHRSGGPRDSDVYGAQQHVPLFDVEIDDA